MIMFIIYIKEIKTVVTHTHNTEIRKYRLQDNNRLVLSICSAVVKTYSL